jgi:hypothetical protein
MATLSCPPYILSILLPSDAYEKQLNKEFMAAVHATTDGSIIASLSIMPGPPNQAYFLHSFLDTLQHLPYGVQIITPQEEFDREQELYDTGRPDPVTPGATIRAISLDIRLEIDGPLEARLSLLEILPGDLVLANLMFDSNSLKIATGDGLDELPRLRTLLFELIGAYPVLIGTMGVDIVAIPAEQPDDVWQLSMPSSPHLLTAMVKGCDVAYIAPSVSGTTLPCLHDAISVPRSTHDEDLPEEHVDFAMFARLHKHIVQAEDAYERMYDSAWPKDERDDALGHLETATCLAQELGLKKEAESLHERYEHIYKIFDSQFRL